FILLNQENNFSVNAFVTRNFTPLANQANQGTFMIISHPALYNDGNGINYVEQYRQYRSSLTGGSFNTKVYDIKELVDHFGYGIKNHPSSIRDFILYANQQFAVKPAYVFLIGRGMEYVEINNHLNDPLTEKLGLVPTFGSPASDVLLAAAPGSFTQVVPIGRLSVVNGKEIGNYLEKVKQYDQAQQTPNPTIAAKAWMKDIVHVIGGKDSIENAIFRTYMEAYEQVAEDTLFGGYVETFSKTSAAVTQVAYADRIKALIDAGLGLISYFGHSSANNFEFNLTDPTIYNNAGKYPFFNVSGCNASNFYNYDPARLTGNMTISESYVLTPQKGSIGFLADSHFGVPPYLNFYNKEFYKRFSKTMYGNTVGNQLKGVTEALVAYTNFDFLNRLHVEQITLHGDPAIKINSFPKPDYVIEDQSIKISPNIITVADNNFNVNIKMQNIGKAISDTIWVSVKRKLPNDTISVLYNKKIKAILYADSIQLQVPINPLIDKGLNQLIVTLDVTNKVDELFETNNTITKDFYVFEDELRPVFPYNFSIVNRQNITFSASTANPLSGIRQYAMEMDTTELFNSPFKKTYNTSGPGGLVQFTPANLTFTDSIVYYWRVSIVPVGGNQLIWNNASFLFIQNGMAGYNQSHSFQHLKSTSQNITYAPNNKWKFNASVTNIKIKNGVFPTAANQASDFTIEIDDANYIKSACGVSAIIFNVFNPYNLSPWENVYPGTGLYGSDNVCGPERRWNFQYNILSQSGRIAAVNFLNLVPAGYYVTARMISGTDPASNTYANQWKNDTLVLGSGNSLYHSLKNAGFATIDSFNRPRAFNFIYKKQDATFTPAYLFSEGIFDKIALDATTNSIKTFGTITSPLFGPALSWKEFHWRGFREEVNAGDSVSFNIIGVTPSGVENILYTIDSTTKDLNISAINATQYPYLKLKMFTRDSLYGTPYQLRYWRVNGTYVPEGAVAPNILFSLKDTANAGEIVDFKLAFKNISETAFADSLKINFIITDRNNVPHAIYLPKGKALVVGDTLVVNYKIDTRNYLGMNTIFVEINPANDQPEQHHFNNILYKNLFVGGDQFNPLLDVTFDGVHILNRDLVSARPHILINLKDENKTLSLTDTSYLKVQVRFPDGVLHDYNFGDILRFTPANLSTGNNTATIDFLPVFTEEGEYELLVSGRDVSGNTAGAIEYRITFSVITKAMISNLLNYPNPFTTSTAFVFTVTGSEVPQNMRIQVLTVTGKIVREITSGELGPLHIGRNITEFKWDGTDQYGAKLANGVYLYRVLTNLNGRSLERYKAEGDQTDKFFNKGYGKMVIIR
ncbi:MAG: C25 family cysteine peptidase, partial [Ferruginibacter sp.]